jgi:hypothetical protein
VPHFSAPAEGSPIEETHRQAEDRMRQSAIFGPRGYTARTVSGRPQKTLQVCRRAREGGPAQSCTQAACTRAASALSRPQVPVGRFGWRPSG